MRIKEGVLKDDVLTLESLEVELDHTTLLILSGYGGFALCGALDVGIYNTEKMKERKELNKENVKRKLEIAKGTLEQLYEAPIVDLSDYARSLNIAEGMKVKDGFKILAEK